MSRYRETPLCVGESDVRVAQIAVGDGERLASVREVNRCVGEPPTTGRERPPLLPTT
ncbi:hypothetical protein H9659_13440 [Sporosarcina sp. Sa3CUA8]|uniref:Uncharacterized protein n=1 Tax=Sporosarcina gallistercoris TaxID=2762245 RepID=A0ABR8PMD4_9BACL|nr:hypothetical protein [Sporosarcina gallistercoris]